jgi:hypothetical protein
MLNFFLVRSNTEFLVAFPSPVQSHITTADYFFIEHFPCINIITFPIGYDYVI